MKKRPLQKDLLFIDYDKKTSIPFHDADKVINISGIVYKIVKHSNEIFLMKAIYLVTNYNCFFDEEMQDELLSSIAI